MQNVKKNEKNYLFYKKTLVKYPKFGAHFRKQI